MFSLNRQQSAFLFLLALLALIVTGGVINIRNISCTSKEIGEFVLELKSTKELYNTSNVNLSTVEQYDTSDVNSFMCEHVHIADQTNSPCYKMLFPHLISKPAWHFLGDSQIGHLAFFMKSQYPYPVSKVYKADSQCGFLDYCKMPKSDTWIDPTPYQGPRRRGLRNHFCSDLTGTDNTMYSSSGKNFMEVLVVEYTSDVEQQTSYTNTTQETVSRYLRKQLVDRKLVKDDSVCVANAGLHDQGLCKDGNMSDHECVNMYVDNLKRYLQLLDPVCGSIVWIGNTHVLGSKDYPQTNNRTILFNEGVKDIIQDMALFWEGYPKLFFVDVWNASCTASHKDNVHFTHDYYRELGSIFTKLM